MKYTPQSERELRDALLLEPGDYDFEVVEAKDTVSKSSGNEMIALKLRIFPGDDSPPRLVNDYLVPGSSLGELKINRFCHAVGIEDTYFSGELTGLSCEGASGRLKLTIQASEQYGDKNQVKDYLVDVEGDESSQAPAKPVGVPASQTRRANKRAKDVDAANEDLQQGFEQMLAAGDDDIPF